MIAQIQINTDMFRAKGVTIKIIVENSSSSTVCKDGSREFGLDSVTSDDKLQGKVLVDVGEDGKIVKGTPIILRFDGIESTRVEYELHDSLGNTANAYGTRPIIAVAVPITTIDALSSSDGITVRKGRYQVPFEIDLPSNLPSSMAVMTSKCSCGISYKLSAEIKMGQVFTLIIMVISCSM